MSWRRIITTPSFGSDWPPYRPLYPDWDNFKVWTRARTMSYTNGTLGTDSGWSDWAANVFDWPAAGFASNNGTTTITAQVDIQTAGRYMPWQLVIQDRISPLGVGSPTFSEYTTDMIPGSTMSFFFEATSGKKREAWKHYVLLPTN